MLLLRRYVFRLFLRVFSPNLVSCCRWLQSCARSTTTTQWRAAFEKAAKDNRATSRRGDVWEIFAGEADISKEDMHQGLQVFQRFDSIYGNLLTSTSV